MFYFAQLLRMYEKIVKHFRKKKDLERFATRSFNLLIFYEELKDKLKLES